MGMIKPGTCWDGLVANGVADDEALEILSILDFPLESVEEDGFGDWDANKSQCLGPIPSDLFMGPPVIPRCKTNTRPPHATPGPVTSINGTPKKKRPHSYLEEASGSRVPRLYKFPEVQESGLFQSQSPISVLESNGSSSGVKTTWPLKSNIAIPKRTRSKRARPSGQNPWVLVAPIFAAAASKKISDSLKNKERRKKLPQMVTIKESSDFEALQNGSPRNTASTKKCSHCEITKTPQWREGPKGPKTLCNACGVRWRSGRLFPEYRPAASPTFVPSLHSNSHKKVIEMRNKAKNPLPVPAAIRVEDLHPVPLQLEYIPSSSYLLDFV